jgi:hypothetical protein
MRRGRQGPARRRRRTSPRRLRRFLSRGRFGVTAGGALRWLLLRSTCPVGRDGAARQPTGCQADRRESSRASHPRCSDRQAPGPCRHPRRSRPMAALARGRRGRWAPVINTALFAIYHFFSPWRYPAIFLGFLPIMWTAAFKGAWQSPRFGRIRPLGRFRAHIGRCSASRTRASRRRQLERER